MSGRVAIIGAGISGLTAAHWLQMRGVPAVVYEAAGRSGGMVQTSLRDGFQVELGPNTIMTNSSAVPRLVDELGLLPQRMLPSASASTRYIVRGGRPVKVPLSPTAAIGTPLLSVSAKLRVLAEPFIGKSNEIDESLASFVRRRLGGEFLDALIDPFVAGVYAGDPEQLSLAHALPKMAALEQKYGSMIKGAILGAKERKARNAAIAGEPRMFSFDAGLGVLTGALAAELGDSVRLNCAARAIRRHCDRSWTVVSAAGSEKYAAVLMCAPAHRLPGVADDFRHFTQIHYPPIARIALGFRRSQVAHPLDGFGALVPRVEHRKVLGVLFSSSMFPNRAPQDHVLLTVFAGGARDTELMNQPTSEIVRLAIEDVRNLLGITGQPVFQDVVKIERSIPQYNVGYGAVKAMIARVESRSPGLFFSGNFNNGISVSDCIAGGAAAAERVAAYVPVNAPREVAHA